MRWNIDWVHEQISNAEYSGGRQTAAYGNRYGTGIVNSYILDVASISSYHHAHCAKIGKGGS